MPILSEKSNLVWNGHKPENLSKPKIYAMPAGYSGCAFWRYRLPLKKLQKVDPSIEINIADNPNKSVRMEDVQAHVQTSDLITIQSPGYKDVILLMKLYKSEGKKVVVDYDDYSFDLSPGNPRYSELGTQEGEILGPDGKPAFKWRDQENGFDLKANQEKYAAFKTCIEQADLITTTTEYLADKFREHNVNVAICPNSIDFDLWRPLPRPETLKDQIRIGWFGGDSHFVDLRIFKTLLPRLAKQYPQTRFVFQAPPVPAWRDFFKDIPGEQVEWYGWSDLRYYTLFLASRHWDIGLCPLEDNDFNRCKSSIKQFEFNALGAAVVAQNMTPYANTISNGNTGLLANTEEEWFEAIAHLIEDKKFRNSIAMNGYIDTFEKWNLDKNCLLWGKAYRDLLERN